MSRWVERQVPLEPQRLPVRYEAKVTEPSYNFPVRFQLERDHSAKCPTCVWVAPFYMNSRYPFALEVPVGGWPDDGIRSCGACGAGWTATEKCSHENQQT